MGRLMKSGICYTGTGGGGSITYTEITLAEYEELTYEQKHNGELYFITDVDGDALFTDLTATLTAGETGLVFTENSITTNSTIDVYTDTFGVNPTNVTVSAGSVTLTFAPQANDLGVKVRIWGVQSGISIVYKNYIKFNGTGYVTLPWTLDADYKVEVVFYETTYANNTAIIGTTGGGLYSHLTEYSNAYYCSNGNGEVHFGTWSSGEHTFITNNGNNYNEFDGVEVTAYTPTTASVNYTIGGKVNDSRYNYTGYIKSYKVYSIANSTLLHDLHPALVGGQSCFLDIIDNAIYCNNAMSAVDTIS